MNYTLTPATGAWTATGANGKPFPVTNAAEIALLNGAVAKLSLSPQQVVESLGLDGNVVNGSFDVRRIRVGLAIGPQPGASGTLVVSIPYIPPAPPAPAATPAPAPVK